jgi:hypothetical protein
MLSGERIDVDADSAFGGNCGQAVQRLLRCLDGFRSLFHVRFLPD